MLHVHFCFGMNLMVSEKMKFEENENISSIYFYFIDAQGFVCV